MTPRMSIFGEDRKSRGKSETDFYSAIQKRLLEGTVRAALAAIRK